MRRKEREIKDFDQIIEVLSRCRVLHLAMISEGRPYSVPVNFGFIVNDKEKRSLSIFIHGAGKGKKVSALKENPEVCFSTETGVSMESANGTDVPCSWTCYYESIIGYGKVRFLDDFAEREKGLDALMLHNGYKIPAGIKKIAYGAMELANTMVAEICVEEITGKRNRKK